MGEQIEDPAGDAERSRLVRRHFHEPFSPEGMNDLLSVVRHSRLTAGQAVLRQGTNDDDLFLVLSGKVQVRIDLPAGGAVTVDEVGPGGVVGEMALLTGNARSATVTALEQVDFAQLARGDFERLALKHPDALNEFLQRLVPRLRRTQMIQALIALFGELDAAALADLEKELAWVRLRGGDTLFREGDHGNDVYIIVNGRLRASVVDGEGHVRILEEVGRGAAIGELALLTGEPRAATIVAVRDSDLLKLSRDSFRRAAPAAPARDDADRARCGDTVATLGPGCLPTRSTECFRADPGRSRCAAYRVRDAPFRRAYERTERC